MSMSGMDVRSGLRNRSNSSPSRIGSRLVIPSAYATSDPAAEPRPGPTRMPTFLAWRTRSATTRKYAGNPFCAMTSSSNSARAVYSSPTPDGNRQRRPSSTWWCSQLASLWPGGTANRGMRSLFA